jgi:antitoxin HicB
MRYPVVLRREPNGAIHASFPDLPDEGVTGEYESDALAQAARALAGALGARIRHRRPIPVPSPAAGRPQVAVPALVAAKIRIYEVMRAAGMGRAELARRLNWHPQQVDRLLDVKHESRLDRVEAAAAALGMSLTVHLEPTAPDSEARLRRRREPSASRR